MTEKDPENLNDDDFEFCSFFIYIIDKYPLISYFDDMQYIRGLLNCEAKYIAKNIDDAIHYLKYLSDNNYPYASLSLSCIYKEEIYNIKNIDKGIHYLTLAADQNSLIAQLVLGQIYLNGYYNKYDTNKAIHYLTLAANQCDAQCYLGFISDKEQCIERNKSMAKYMLCMKQYHLEAQYILACYYFNNKKK